MNLQRGDVLKTRFPHASCLRAGSCLSTSGNRFLRNELPGEIAAIPVARLSHSRPFSTSEVPFPAFFDILSDVRQNSIRDAQAVFTFQLLLLSHGPPH